jgi:hypothetical protein
MHVPQIRRRLILAMTLSGDDARGMHERYSNLHRNILDVFDEHGVQIMTPAYENDPAEPKIVPRDKWNPPPAGKA